MDELPGQFPFTRGVHAAMYRDLLWTMRQYAGFSTAEESNKRYHFLLGQGVSGLSVAFDLPTQIGYDSDHPMAEGEVGKVGVAIDSLQDMELLFKDICLSDISTSMTINSTAFILLALYIALAKKQGADIKKISGTIQNDILKEYAARGTYIYARLALMRCRNWLSPWPMARHTFRRPLPRASILMYSHSGCHSSSMHIITFLKKWPNSGLPGACGRRSPNHWAPPTLVHRCSGFIPRQAAAPSPHSSPKTTSCA